MLHITAVALPASAIATLSSLLFIGLGIGAGVEYYQKKNVTVGKNLAISSGTFALVAVIAFLVWKVAK